MTRPAKPTVARNGTPLPQPRSNTFSTVTPVATVTRIVDRELEVPSEFVIESLPVSPIKKPSKSKKKSV